VSAIAAGGRSGQGEMASTCVTWPVHPSARTLSLAGQSGLWSVAGGVYLAAKGLGLD